MSDGDFLVGEILLKTIGFERPGGREWLPSGTLSCSHFLCEFRLGICFSANHAHANYIGTRYAISLRRDPRTSFLHFFRKRFRTRACTDLQCSLAQKWFFCNVKKVRSKGPIRYAAWGLPQGPAFACTLTILNKTKKQKLKNTSFVWESHINETFCVPTACANMFT